MSYTSGAGATDYGEWNFAKSEFNVGLYPDKPSFRMPFSLRSKDGFVFMFMVHGEIEVTRQ